MKLRDLEFGKFGIDKDGYVYTKVLLPPCFYKQPDTYAFLCLNDLNTKKVFKCDYNTEINLILKNTVIKMKVK